MVVHPPALDEARLRAAVAELDGEEAVAIRVPAVRPMADEDAGAGVALAVDPVAEDHHTQVLVAAGGAIAHAEDQDGVAARRLPPRQVDLADVVLHRATAALV